MLQQRLHDDFSAVMKSRSYALATAGAFYTLAKWADLNGGAFYLAIAGSLVSFGFALYFFGRSRVWLEYQATLALALLTFALLQAVPGNHEIQTPAFAGEAKPPLTTGMTGATAGRQDIAAEAAVQNGRKRGATPDPLDRPFTRSAARRPAELCRGATLVTESAEGKMTRCMYRCSDGGSVLTMMRAPLTCPVT